MCVHGFPWKSAHGQYLGSMVGLRAGPGCLAAGSWRVCVRAGCLWRPAFGTDARRRASRGGHGSQRTVSAGFADRVDIGQTGRGRTFRASDRGEAAGRCGLRCGSAVRSSHERWGSALVNSRAVAHQHGEREEDAATQRLRRVIRQTVRLWRARCLVRESREGNVSAVSSRGVRTDAPNQGNPGEPRVRVGSHVGEAQRTLPRINASKVHIGRCEHQGGMPSR